MDYEKDAVVDIVAVVRDVGECTTLMSKAQKEFTKRELSLVDETGYQVRVTLFGKSAENWSINDVNPVLAIKNAKIGDFGGRTLSCSTSSTMQINPDLPDAHQVRGWYDNQVDASTVFQTYSSEGGYDNGGGRNEVFKTIAQVKEENVGAGEKPDYFSIRGCIAFIKDQNIAYTACPLEGCNKKVVEDSSGWRCEKCNKSYDAPIQRYTLNISILDHTGQLWVSVFNDMGCKLFGKDANEMVRLKDENEAKFAAIGQQKLFSRFNFKIRAKQENYNDELKLKSNLVGLNELDYPAENSKLVQMINAYL
jgi:replication factor A1